MISNNSSSVGLQIFSNNKNYQEHREFYRAKIKSNNQQYIVKTIISIIQTLKRPTKNPINKLLALRLFRQCINCISYGFLTLANIFLCPILIEIALYKKQSQQQQRGRTLFSAQQYLIIEKKELQVIGYSTHKLVLQIYMTMSQWLPYLPYHDYSFASNFTKGFQLLKKEHVKFPEKLTYFKSKDTDRFLNVYHRFLSQYKVRKNNIEDVRLFYQYVFGKKYELQQLPYQKIIINIIRTGDIFVCDYFIKYIQSRGAQILKGIDRQYFEKDLFELLNFIYQGLKVGEYQFLLAIEPDILPLLLKLILRDSPIKNQRTRRRIETIIWQWSEILKQVSEIDINKTFKALNKLIENGPKPIIEQKLFKKNWQELSENKKLKKKICSQKNLKTNLETIQLYLSQLSQQQFIPKKPVMIANGNKSSLSNVKNTKIQQATSRVKVQPLSFMEQIKSGIEKTDRKKLRQQVEVLRSIHKKNTPRNSNNRNSYQAQSHQIIPNSHRYSSFADNFQSQHSIGSQNYDKKIEELERIIEISKVKQKKYELIIEQKNQQIVSLSAQVTPLKSKVFDSQLLSNSNISKSKQAFGPSKQNPLNHLQTKSNKAQKKLFLFPTKTKKELLKNKLLLTKSVEIQLGMINLGLQTDSCNIINTNIYVTPMISFESIQISVRSPQWISVDICNNRIKYNVKPSSQYILGLKVKLKQKQNRKHYNSLPQLTLKGVKDNKNIEVKVYLPIFLNRFIQFSNLTSEQCSKFLNLEITGQLLKKQQKILKNFEAVLHYFPAAIMLGDKNLYAVKIMFEKNEAYLLIKNVNKQYVIIQLLQAHKWDLDQLQLVGNVYRSLLTIVS